MALGTTIAKAQDTLVSFTSDEKEWKAKHHTLRLGIGVAFPPFMWVEKENGHHLFKGMVSDYVDLLSQKLGMDMQIVFGLPFSEALALGQEGRIDLFPCISKTPERSKFLLFTNPYLSYPLVIVTQEDAPVIGSVKDLKGKRFATVEHLVVYNKMKNNYSHLNINYVFTKKVEENLEAVSLGLADACVINLAAATYFIQKKGITNLRVAAPVDWEGVQLSMGVRKDWPILQGIIEKGLAAISQEEKDQISQKWIRAKYELGVPIGKIWRWSLGIGLAVIFILVLISSWNRRLRKEIVERINAENDQVESERKLTTLIGNLPGIAYRCLNDKNWTMTFISDGCKDLTGYNPSELIDNRGLAYGDLIVLEDRQTVWSAVQAAISENRSFTIEYRIEDKNKNEKWVWERGSCTSELKGKKPVLEGFISDITERKRAEKSLRDSSKLNELMLNSLPHPTMLISKKRIILAANKVALDTGVEIGRLCWDTFGHRDCISEEHKQRIESSSNCFKDDILCTFCLADNLIKTGETQNDPEVLAFGKLWDTWWVPIDEDTYLHYAIDITERKYAANRLLKEIERSNLLLELYLQAPKLSDKELYDYTLNKAVDLTDSTTGFFHQVSEDQKSIILNTWNTETLKTCGADQGLHYLIENAGNWVDCFHTQKPLVYNDFSNSPNQKGLPEGHVSIERFMSIPVMEEDKVRYIFGVGNKSDDYDDFDVTQLQLVANELYNIIKQRNAEKELEKLQTQLVQGQKMESIGTLAGGIAHDFNNILSSILGFTELAMDDVEKESMIEDNLQEVHNAGKRAKDLVAQILAFARQSDEKIQPTQVNKIVEEVLQFIRSSIPTNIEIKKNIDSDSPILGNQTQIYQIIMNICTNAAYAMDENGGVLSVSLKDTEVDQVLGEKLDLNQDHYITISITDTGVGIPPDILDSIFDPYFTTKGPGEGTGMGLAMAHGIVESYGGKIYVNSTLGKGTTFTIYLPIALKRTIQRQDEPEELPRGLERILFVDDEAPLAKMGTRTLEALGYRVRTLTSSVDALDLFILDPNEFDLVISDITMPNMTGDKLAVELKKLRPEIPIILCTGYSKRMSGQHATEIGVNAIMYKPIGKVDLAKTVREILDEAKR